MTRGGTAALLSAILILGAVAPAAAVPDSDHDGVPDGVDPVPQPS